MKKRIIQFLTTYFLFVLYFVLQKPIFMVYYHDLYTNVSLGDYFRVMWHGLPLDLSLAGYLTAIPGILLIASAWTNSSILRRIRHFYHRLGIVRILGIPSGRHSYFLFLLFSQRCHGKCQFLVCSTWNSGYIDLCSNSILYFLLCPYPGEKASENTLSTPECLACTAFADSGTLHPYPGRIQRIHHEFKQGVFQSGPTHESCSH